jgi:N-acetylneuraminic acid mutarotase
LNGKLYVVGGADRLTAGNHISGTYSVHSTTYVYDPQADAWSAVAPLPAALAGVALAAADGKLYAFGGFDARGPSLGTVDATYAYDPAANTWLTRTAILSGTRALAAATELDGKIYLVGGVTSGGPYWSTLDSVNVYDPATDTWSSIAPLHTAVHSPGLAAAPDGSVWASPATTAPGRSSRSRPPGRSSTQTPSPASPRRAAAPSRSPRRERRSPAISS